MKLSRVKVTYNNCSPNLQFFHPHLYIKIYSKTWNISLEYLYFFSFFCCPSASWKFEIHVYEWFDPFPNPGQWLINMFFFLLFLLHGCGLISNQTNSNLQSWMLSWSRWLGGWSLVLTCAILVERPPTASQNLCGMLKYTWTLHITVWSVRNSSRPEMPLQFTIVDIMKERFYLLGPQLINSTFAKKNMLSLNSPF